MSHYIRPLAAQTAGGADVANVIAVIEASNDIETNFVAAFLSPPAADVALTGVATNNVTFSLRQIRAGAVLAVFAAVTFDLGVNLAAETPVPFAPTGPLPALAPGDVIDCLVHQNGAGLAVNAGILCEIELN